MKKDIAATLALPVVCSAGDMLCLLLGGGMVEKGRSCGVTGTAADVSVYLAELLLSPRLMNLHHAVEGWISFGILDSGGGAKSALWCQMKADIYEKEIMTLRETEGGIIGAAMLTFSGVTEVLRWEYRLSSLRCW